MRPADSRSLALSEVDGGGCRHISPLAQEKAGARGTGLLRSLAKNLSVPCVPWAQALASALRLASPALERCERLA